jgi:hypothetical protein
MKTKFDSLIRTGMAGLVLLLVAGCASSEIPPQATYEPDAQQQVFPTPEAAADALADATRNGQQDRLIKILGPRGEPLIHSGDKVADRRSRERFIAAYDRHHEIQAEGDRRILVVGAEGWPMPIPLNQSAAGWWFDTDAGDDEILNRRIGRNELNVIEVCRAYVDAQEEYAASHPIGRHRHEYAQHIVSSEGKQDGLYWPVGEGEKESPLGPLIAKASAQGYVDKDNPQKHERSPYHGYYYKTLRRQGPNAPGGAMSYVVKDHMTRGFALLAYPARWGDSGVMTFIVSQNGIIYQRNLGPDTVKIARHINEFDPDSGWTVVE